jgi:hypothetical protein
MSSVIVTDWRDGAVTGDQDRVARQALQDAGGSLRNRLRLDRL